MTRTRRGTVVRSAVAGCLVVLAALVPLPAGGQQPTSSFLARAAADGLRLSATLRGYFVVEEFADLGAPTAEATVGDVGSAALAGYPWPGETPLAVLLLTGLPVPYPMAARSTTTGARESEVIAGPVVLSAKSTEQASQASAQGGFAGNGLAVSHTASRASTVLDPGTGTAEAQATNVAEGLSIGDVLKIGAVRSRASVNAKPGEEPERSSALEVMHAEVAGHAISFGPDGISVDGSQNPIPTSDALVAVLAEAGVTLEYLKAEHSMDGVTAAGLRITLTEPVPGAPEPLSITLELGRATATARPGRPAAGLTLSDPLQDTPPAPFGGVDDSEVEDTTQPPTVAQVGLPDSPTVTEMSTPTLTLRSGAATGTRPSSLAPDADRSSADAIPGLASNEAAALVGAGGESAVVLHGGGFYLVLAGCALLLLSWAMAHRFLAERSLWNS